MYYPKNQEKELSPELFLHPTAEYRGVPFWAWNDDLEKEELARQIDEFAEMGFGGFVMHPRSGLKTPYLGQEFMDFVRHCDEKAKDNQMLAWLYDEDRYPSGFAGGFVTKEKRFRMRELLLTMDSEMANLPTEDPGNGDDFLVGVYDLQLNLDGTLKAYPYLEPGQTPKGTALYAVCYTSRPSGWHNGQAYVDNMNPEAVRKFLEITYDAYQEAVGGEFGKTVPAIFTDEPRVYRAKPRSSAHSKENYSFAWTPDFPETFQKAYGYDIRPHLPELLWQLPEGKPSRSRYLYHDHRTERFTQAYLVQISAWCKEHGIAFSGHMPGEHVMDSQIESVGEVMRAYGHFDIPGMDLLMDMRRYNIAKQCQSTVHQYGKEAMLSELYGVTGWDFDFRQHKLQGDWQAALGVSIRTPHLSWYSMRGSGKRDYPASIHYQSAWYREYACLEDHYARVNTAMTRGKPVVEIAVLHPMESNWLEFGTADLTGAKREELQNNFETVYEWLLHGTLDFDYLCESILPSLWCDTDAPCLQVGKMAYKTVIVAGCETIRSTTVEILAQFQKHGGEVIFMGEPPRYVDAMIPEEDNLLFTLLANAKQIPFAKTHLLSALEHRRDVDIQLDTGLRGEDWVYNLRQDGDSRWLFLATAVPAPGGGKKGTHPELDGKAVTLTIRGRWKPTYYDTFTGEISAVPYSITGSNTQIQAHLYCHDSMLLRLTPAAEGDTGSEEGKSLLAWAKKPGKIIDWKCSVPVSRAEDNVLILDLAQWSEDGENYFPLEEIRWIDRNLRKKYHYPNASGRDIQPWCLPMEPTNQFVYLRFDVNTEIEIAPKLAYEAVDAVWLDGKPVQMHPDGWYTDRNILAAPLPTMEKGTHQLVVKVPFGARESLENLFLLGNFDVELRGIQSRITAPSGEVAFGDLVHQGMPFYGGAATYTLNFETEEDAQIALRTLNYKGAVVTAALDGGEEKAIVLSPYRLDLGLVPAGKHTAKVTVYLTRNNSFAALHNTSGDIYKGGVYWYSKGDSFAYEYQLAQSGLLQSPKIEIYPKVEA